MRIARLLKGGISEICFGYNTQLGGYTTLMPDIPELATISNSPSHANGNLNHWTGVASFNHETEGIDMRSIASQLPITQVRRLHFAPTQIFNNS